MSTWSTDTWQIFGPTIEYMYIAIHSVLTENVLKHNVINHTTLNSKYCFVLDLKYILYWYC